MKIKNLDVNSMRKISKLIIHTSDSPDHLDIGVKEITEWHKQQGWSDVGYHYVIRRDGTIEEGRPVARPGAHTAGHNSDSIGICWVGRSKITRDQKGALLQLLSQLLNKFDLDTLDIYGHNDFNSNKSCPNISVEDIRVRLESIRNVSI